jgi:hypothetical protein
MSTEKWTSIQEILLHDLMKSFGVWRRAYRLVKWQFKKIVEVVFLI